MTARFDPRVALWIGGEWVDLTAQGDVRARTAHSGGGISIGRGVPNGGGRYADPGEMSLTLNNRFGRYSARNPRGEYFGLIGRNTPIRVTAGGDGLSYLWLPGRDGQLVTTPDHASLDITGDIDIRVDLTPNVWSLTGLYQMVASKWASVGDERSWAVMLHPSGCPYWTWYTDGVTAFGAVATEPVPQAPGRRMAFRVTLDVDNGSGGRTTTFYTAPTIDGPWTQLGDPVTNNTATTSIYSSSAPVEIGTADGGSVGFGSTVRYAGRVHAVEIRNGIGGTYVAGPDGTAEAGVDEFEDPAGLTWTVDGDAEIIAAGTRARMAVPEWPPRWDLSGADVWTTIQAAGILRQLGQGRDPLASPLARHWGAITPVSGYWRLEDGSDAESAASDTPGVAPATVTAVEFAADDTLPGAAPVAKLTDSTSRIAGTGIPMDASPSAWAITWCFKLPAIPAGTTPLMTIHCSAGTIARWDISVTPTAYHAQGYDGEGNLVASDLGTHAGAGPPDRWIAMHFGVEDVGGGTINFAIFFTEIGSGQFWNISDSYSGTCGRADRWEVTGSTGYTGGSLAHVLLVPTKLLFVDRDLAAAANGYQGETAGQRAMRLGEEEGVAVEVIGDWADSAPMGRQSTLPFVQLLQECADADRGYLLETRDVYGLTLRTLRSLYNQTPLELDYSAGHISAPFDPTDDDALVRNDVTVSRPGGSSARAVRQTGPLNVQDPRHDPDGVGRYKDDLTLNLATDAQLPFVAQWLRALGTDDEARYPSIRVDLTAVGWRNASAELVAAAIATDTGDLLRLGGLPDWLPPGPVEALATGYTEFIDLYDWDLTWNAVPASRYRVGVLAVSTRLAPRSQVVDTFFAGADTELLVERTDPAGLLWITTATRPGNFPFDVMAHGIRLRVTGITGTGDPQTLTVQQAPINGVTGVIPPGTPVTLAEPWRLAL